MDDTDRSNLLGEEAGIKRRLGENFSNRNQKERSIPTGCLLIKDKYDYLHLKNLIIYWWRQICKQIITMQSRESSNASTKCWGVQWGAVTPAWGRRGKSSQGELTWRTEIPSYRKKVKGTLDGQSDMEKGIETQKYVAYLGLTQLPGLKGTWRGGAENAPGKVD